MFYILQKLFFILHRIFTKKCMANDRNYLIDSTTEKIESYILSKGLKAGNLIPKEIELAEEFGVSRPIVRESLGRLKAKGLLESRRKRGTVITSPKFTEVIKTGFNPNVLDETTLRELFELRLALEVGMADFVIANRTKKDVAELYKIVKNEPVSDEPVYFDPKHEIKFHGKIYEMTKNSSMINFQQMLLPIFEYVHTSGLLKKAFPSKKTVTHIQLVEVIESGTTNDFRRAIRQHLDPHYQRLSIS